MATVASIAIRKEAAFDQIAEAATTIGAELGLEAPVFELYGRDPDDHHAQHLEQVAEYLQKVAGVLAARAVVQLASPEPTDPVPDEDEPPPADEDTQPLTGKGKKKN